MGTKEGGRQRSKGGAYALPPPGLESWYQRNCERAGEREGCFPGKDAASREAGEFLLGRTGIAPQEEGLGWLSQQRDRRSDRVWVWRVMPECGMYYAHGQEGV